MQRKWDGKSDTNSEGSLLDGTETWFVANLRGVWVVVFVLAVLCFMLWLVTMLVWPAQDMRRARRTVTLESGRSLIVDYPKRFLADDDVLAVYLTADSFVPLSVTLKLQKSLPLILVSAEPSSTLRIEDASEGLVTLVWPPITSAPTQAPTGGQASPDLSTTPEPIAILPVLSHPHTISLYFRNADSVACCSPLAFGFTTRFLNIVGAKKNGAIPIKIETINRASWRAFAEKYSFLVVLPFLATVFLSLGKAYTDRQKDQRLEAGDKLEKFKQAMSTGDLQKVTDAWGTLRQYRKYLAQDDWQRAERIENLSRGDIAGRDDVTWFTTWPDTWAGALRLGWLGFQKTELDATFYRYIRVFPRDLLTPSAERDFSNFVAFLKLPDTQQPKWPEPATDPKDYSTEWPKTIAEFNLFSASTADDEQERRLLFSNKDWFWRAHPLYTKVLQSPRPTLVWGKPGCGRTAFALALTRYARVRYKVLGSYHSQAATLTQVQQQLAKELLAFIRVRSMWLTKLTPEDRSLLAAVLCGALDKRLALAALGKPEPSQFNSIDANKNIWEKQAQVEFRLLSQSIGQIETPARLSEPQWFEAFGHCARRLGFERVHMALDMTSEQYGQWRAASLYQFLAALPDDSDFSIRLIILTPGTKEGFDVQQFGIDVHELRWDADPAGGETPLVLMLQHRAEQRLKDSVDMMEEILPEQVQGQLVVAARHNPQLLAQIWQRIVRENSDAKRVEESMIKSLESEGS